MPSWKRSALPALATETPGRTGTCLLFLDDRGLGTALGSRLERDGRDVVYVKAGGAFSQEDATHFTIVPADRQHYDTLVQKLTASGRRPGLVVHLWGVTDDIVEADPVAFETTQERGFYSLLYLAQTLAEVVADAHLQLEIVTTGLREVTGDERLVPAKATMIGPCRVIGQEIPRIACRNTDVLLPPAGAPLTTLADQLLAEFDTLPFDPSVAYRGRHRWVETLDAVRLEPAAAPQPVRLRPNGVYLITGGLGGIALTVARHLAASAGARLALVGRTALPPRAGWDGWLEAHGEDDAVSRRIARVRELEAAGAQVLLLSADVSDAEAMREAVASAVAHYGALNGVIHAAGVAGGGILQLKTREQAERVLAPKVRGTLALDEAVADIPLDFMVLCSSVNALTGGAGQIDYCAANAFLDAFARHRSVVGGVHTVSVNWGTWAEVGMAVETEVPLAMRAERDFSLRFGIKPAEGIEALQRILATPLAQVLVHTYDLRPLAETAKRTLQRQIAAATAGVTETGTVAAAAAPTYKAHARPSLRTAYEPPQTPLQIAVADIWRELLGVDQVGLHDDFFDLGGHSLLATQVVSRIHDRFKIRVSLRSLFEAKTVADLAERLETLTWVAEGPAPVASGDEEREEMEI